MLHRFLLHASAFAAVILHADAVQICGGKGYDLRTQTYNEVDGVALATLAYCGPRCKSDPKCLSFAFGKGQCLLYSVPVDGNLNSDSESPFQFYDRDCVTSPSPSPSPSPSTTRTTIAGPTGGRPPMSVAPTTTPRPTTKTIPTPVPVPTTISTSIRPTTSTTASLPAAPTPSGPECGLGGFSNANTTFYDSSGSYGNQTTCAAKCKSLSCGSYGVGSNTCLVYAGNVASSISFSATSVYHFWDASCPITA